MLLKIYVLTLRYGAQGGNDLMAVESSVEKWINPERVSYVEINPRYYGGFAHIHITKEIMTVSLADARRVIDHINGSPDAEPTAAATPSAADDGILVHLEQMTLDSFFSKTAGSARRMWRCTTTEGYSFNIFDHVDHRNTYSLFKEYHLWMDDMTDGQVLDWSATPISLYLKRNGDFYNPILVA